MTTNYRSNNNGSKKNSSVNSQVDSTLAADEFIIKTSQHSLSLDDIVGQEEAIKTLKEFVRQVLYKNIYSQWNVWPSKGILLTGSPGLGKTAAVRALGQELNSKVHLMELRYLDIASKWIDAPIENLRSFFKVAEKLSKSAHVIIFIDEIDSMIPNRNSELHETTLKRVNIFLEWMDGGFIAQNNITIIGATNYVEGIDKAALRPGRFDKIIEFKNLTAEAINKGLKIHLSKKNLPPSRLGKINWDSIKNIITDGQFSGADLNDIINRIVNKKIEEHLKILDKKYDFPLDDLADSAINNINNLPSKITDQDFIEVIKEIGNAQLECFSIGFQ